MPLPPGLGCWFCCFCCLLACFILCFFVWFFLFLVWFGVGFVFVLFCFPLFCGVCVNQCFVMDHTKRFIRR